MHIPRSATSRLVSLAAVILVAAGCTSGGTSAGPDEGATDAATSTESAAPDEGDSTTGDTASSSAEPVTIGVTAEPPTLNPALTTDYTTGVVTAPVFDGLVEVTADFTPEPSLAESWEVSEDGLTYEFTLREGVEWHDGEPFTSRDVVYSFNEALKTFHPRASGLIEELGLEATADGDHAVSLTIDEPYAPLMKQLAVTEAPILPAHLYEGTDFESNPANEAPIGTGPFEFVEWASGSHVQLTPNPDHWTGGPEVGDLVVSIVPEASNLAVGLETGEIDFVPPYYIERSDIERLYEVDGVEPVERTGIPALHLLMMNTTRAPLDDPAVRSAIATAIDRQSIVDLAMSGEGLPGAGSFGDAYPWARAADGERYASLYAHDPAAAEQALADAGVAGQTLSLVYDSANSGFASEAQLIQDQLAAVGVELELVPREKNVVTEQVFADRDFDLTLQSYYSGGDPAIGYHRIYESYDGTAPFTNPTGFANDDVDRLFDEAAALADESARSERYAEALAIINEQLPTLVLLDTTGTTFATEGLEGVWQLADPRDGWNTVRWTS